MKPSEQQLIAFLRDVDMLFPVPLSHKTDLTKYAKKLIEHADLCYEMNDQQQIVSLVAGYTEHLTGNMAYIAIVATRPEYMGKGLAANLVRSFLQICKKKKIDAVHLYAVYDNRPAICMYEKLGFKQWRIAGEPRPNDAHLIYRLKGEEV